jgi:hypothetical protein
MIKFTKQYKPIGFGDGPNLGTVEGHRNAMAEAAETRKLIGDHATTDQEIDEQNEIAEYIFGMVARRNGEPMDGTKSFAWQRGWGEAQE